MTTTLINVDFKREILSFMNPDSQISAIGLLHAFADCLRSKGPQWIQSAEAKALLHSLNKTVYGPHYKLDCLKEQRFLEHTLGHTA